MTAAFRLAPPLAQVPAGLAMPDQRLDRAFADPAAPGVTSGAAAGWIRLAVLGLPALFSLALVWPVLGWLAASGLGIPGVTVVLLTGFAFYWSLVSVSTAAAGFLASRPGPVSRPGLPLRVAILLPMYGEPAQATIHPAVALLQALAQARTPHRFSLHVVSDTRNARAAAVEAAVVARQSRLWPHLAIRYRNRPVNRDFKSGNLRDWVEAQGALHDAMLVLDADSAMDLDSVLQLADALAADPGCALIQSVTQVRPGRSLWQRSQAFASSVYGTTLGRGVALWSGAEANFIGHNAILRTRAFAASAGLPHLSGAAPRGGVILSHDFVEAALLRRAGWAVRALPLAGESSEDTPASLIGHVRRDRRWCQGNLQHLRLLAVPGLHPLSRFHFLQGAMAYLSALWWSVLLILCALPLGAGGQPVMVWTANPLAPLRTEAPVLSPGAMMTIVVMLLLAPKLIGAAAHLRDNPGPLRRLPGFALSLLAEIILAMLVAPTLMVHQVRAVLRTWAGADAGWTPHSQDRAGLVTLLRFHAIETGLGAGLTGLVVAGLVTPWLLPVGVCLLGAVPLSWTVQSDAATGTLFRDLSDRRG